MIYKASTLIAKAFDARNIKYGNRIEQTDGSSYLEAGFNIDNGPSVLVRFINTDNDNDVAVRVFGLLHNVADSKVLSVLSAANECNKKYRYIKLVLDGDNDLNVEYDFPVKTADACVGEMAVEIFIRFMKICEEVYPVLMKALWS